MSEIASAKINSFAHVAQQAEVSPEEPIFVLTGSQLQEIITRATQPLKDEVTQLKATIDSQGEKIKTLEGTTDLNYDDIRDLYAAIDELDLRQKTGPTDEDRIEKLKGYLKGKKDLGHRPEASFTEARAYLEVSRSQFSKLISKLDPREFVIFYHPLNYKAKMIGLARRM